jgi:prefoldin alpha subunit
MKQEDIIEFQMLQQEMQQVQGMLQKMDEQRGTVTQLIADLDSFGSLSGGEEVLFPITNGVFAKGKVTDTQNLHVNVGRGVVVPRTVEQTKALVQEQLDNLVQQQEHVVKQQDVIFAKLEALEKKVSAEDV